MNSSLKLFVPLALAVLCGLAPRANAQTDAGSCLRFGTPTSATVSGFGVAAPTNEITIEFWMRSETNVTQYLLSQSTDVPTNRLAIGGFSTNRQIIWDFGNTTNG